MKKSLVFLLILIATLTMVFANGSQEAPSSSNDGKTEIRIGWWGGDARHEKYRQMLDLYEERNPNITVTREFAGFDGYFDKLPVQAASNNLPDVVHMHLTKVNDYAQRGALLPLNDFVDKGIIDLSDFNQAIIDSGKIGDDIYMVTLGNSITGLYYNETALANLGFEPPKMNMSWADLKNYAMQVQEKLPEGHYVLKDTSTDDTAFDYFLRQRGKSLYDENGKLNFSKQDMSDWLEMWKNFRDEGFVPPMTVTKEEVVDAHGDSLLAKEIVLMQTSPANQLAIYQEYMTDKLDIVRVPGQDTGMNGEFVEGAYISIASNTKYPEEAAKLLNFLVNDPDAVKIFGAEHGALGSAKMNEIVTPQLTEANKIVIEFTQYASQYATPRTAIPTGGPEVKKLLGIAAETVGYGGSIDNAVDVFFEAANRALNIN